MGFWKKFAKIAAIAAPIIAAPFTGGASLALIGAGSGFASGMLNKQGWKKSLIGAGLGAIPGIGKASGVLKGVGPSASTAQKLFGGVQKGSQLLKAGSKIAGVAAEKDKPMFGMNQNRGGSALGRAFGQGGGMQNPMQQRPMMGGQQMGQPRMGMPQMNRPPMMGQPPMQRSPMMGGPMMQRPPMQGGMNVGPSQNMMGQMGMGMGGMQRPNMMNSMQQKPMQNPNMMNIGPNPRSMRMFR